jgi:pyrroline-5-carboxylate reductase
MTQATLCFIGAGNMAGSMIGGLVSKGYPADKIIACDINQERLDQLQTDFNISCESDINKAVSQAAIVILAVKPQVMQSVCGEITHTQHKPLFISIAAGLREMDINRWLGGGLPMVRCMPNTPALVAQGAAGLYANQQVSELQKQQAESIMQSTGITVWVKSESQLDAVTAISGSGPAYFFLFIEALEKAGIQLGLDAETSAKLARQTALGAATMAVDKDVVNLRQQVTSPGGTTEQAIASFISNDIYGIVAQATKAANTRSIELAEQLAQ